VHEQEVDFARVVDEQFFVTVRKMMSRFLVASIANLKITANECEREWMRGWVGTLGMGC
jgi:hypothetical protein